jgi:hypothetical protein
MKKNKKFKAIKRFREKGFSIKEIGRKFEISPSTASLWLRDVKVSKVGRSRLLRNQELGRRKGVETNRNKRRRSLQNIHNKCLVLKKKEKFELSNLKIFLSLLYWGEGGKTGRRVDFTNSDPKMIKIFLSLLRKSFLLRDDRLRAVLHLHNYHDRERMLKYWSNITGIKKQNFIVYNKKNSGRNVKFGYKGCLSVRYGDVKVLEEIFLIIRRFIILFD